MARDECERLHSVASKPGIDLKVLIGKRRLEDRVCVWFDSVCETDRKPLGGRKLGEKVQKRTHARELSVREMGRRWRAPDVARRVMLHRFVPSAGDIANMQLVTLRPRQCRPARHKKVVKVFTGELRADISDMGDLGPLRPDLRKVETRLKVARLVKL